MRANRYILIKYHKIFPKGRWKQTRNRCLEVKYLTANHKITNKQGLHQMCNIDKEGTIIHYEIHHCGFILLTIFN
jgi:hypothetical protein